MAPSRAIRRFFQGSERGASHPFARLNRHYQRAWSVVRLFYLMSAVMAYGAMAGFHQDAIAAADLDLLWPVRWLAGLDLVMWVDILSFGCFASALAASWKPDVRTFRAAFAILLTMSAAVVGSFGGINHAFHAWIWVAVALTFLPTARCRADRLSYCLTLAATQGLLLMFYSLAGLWKAFDGLLAIGFGFEGNLAPRGLALTLADRMLQTGTQPLLAPWLIEYYLLAWPLFLFLIYAQLVAVFIVYRPSLHIPWGLILIAFHAGTWLLMEIWFTAHIMLLLVLLVCSPFARQDWLQWSTIRSLPGFDGIGRLWLSRRKATVLVQAQ